MGVGCGGEGLELVPLLVLVLEHHLVCRLGKVLCLVHHPRRRVIQLSNLLTPLLHQLKEKPGKWSVVTMSVPTHQPVVIQLF